jgi:hypothetical protein
MSLLVIGAVRGFGIVMPEVSVSAETSIAEGGAMVWVVQGYRVRQKAVGSLTCVFRSYAFAWRLFVEVKVMVQVKVVELSADLLLRLICGWNDGEIRLSVLSVTPYYVADALVLHHSCHSTTRLVTGWVKRLQGMALGSEASSMRKRDLHSPRPADVV